MSSAAVEPILRASPAKDGTEPSPEPARTMASGVRVLSVITAVHQPDPDHLLAACEALSSQQIPAGWEWEWIVQEDGHTGLVSRILASDPRVRLGSARHRGVAVARNLGAARARGELLKNLDGDDILAPGVLARDIGVLTADPTIGWTTSAAVDLLPDGSTIGFDDGPPEGRLEPGYVVRYWRAHDYRLPVHPATLCIRRELATALGGWMALPGSEDTGLVVAASVISAGYFHPEVGLLYRKWAGQASTAAEHCGGIERTLRMSLIEERAAALLSFAGQGVSTSLPRT